MQLIFPNLPQQEVGAVLDFGQSNARPKLSDLENLSDLQVAGTVTVLPDRLLVKGRATATVTLQCIRCLEPFPFKLATGFAEEFSEQPTEDQFPYARETVDLDTMLHDVLLLAIPELPVHDPGCQGLCPVCGKNLNRQLHKHQRQAPESPFSSLKTKK